MYLDEIVSAQKRGEARGIPSICSAHPWVLRAVMQTAQQTSQVSRTSEILLVEATCNQVNQFGGYTGMTPAGFSAYVRGIAEQDRFPCERIILGGDHLGPSVWQDEPAESAMEKAEVMIREYAQAGFTKIHLDCSMRLADDPNGALDVEVAAIRAARLAKVAEESLPSPTGRGSGGEGLRYVIGTEVPIPGGATEHEEGVSVTRAEDVRQTISITREVLRREGLESGWERVIAVVVQPGVEFGDDFVLDYQPEKARALAQWIETEPGLVYEAHSTDYQTRDALRQLVRDHFAILKVGPGLTFAFREAVFALALIENEWLPADTCSNLIRVLNDVMVGQPKNWLKYYHGNAAEQAFKRKFSLSDRARYYWGQPEVQSALGRLMKNLGARPMPLSLLRQFAPRELGTLRERGAPLTPEAVVSERVAQTLRDYQAACLGR
jgi:D-tagatose-1,6-bisphosphate aldolase subunit GatZ/KbaZ